MAEFIAAAGAAASILQLAAYSQTVITRVFEFRRDVRETPKAFRNLHVSLPFIKSTAAKIKTRADSGSLDPAVVKDVVPLLNQCQERIIELNAIFKRVIPEPGSSRIRLFWKAVLSVSEDSKVENIAAEVMSFVQLLTLHASIEAPTADEISSIVSTDLENIIDHRIKGIVQDLKERSATSAVTHYNNNNNSSTYLNRSNRNTYYTGQTTITNNFYFNVTDARVFDSLGTVQGAMEGRIPRMITASSHSHPVADFANSANILPWKTMEDTESPPVPLALPVVPPRPKSASAVDLRYAEQDGSGFMQARFADQPLPRYMEPTYAEQSASDLNLPEALQTSASREYPAGFIEPMESASSLAPTNSIRSPSLSSPRSATSMKSPELSRANTGATIRSVHSFSSLRPPLEGYFELDAPAASIAAIQFESPRLAPAFRAPSASSISEKASDSTRSYFQSETGSSDLSDTVIVTEEDEAVTALESANSLLSFASKNVDSSPSQARKAYADAITQYRAIDVGDPNICVRKYRSLVNAELGLSLVVADQPKHIARAETHCSTAMKHAELSTNGSDIYGVKLDQAKVKARFARLQEKSPRTSVLVVGALHGEAFDLFQAVTTELGPKCGSIDDFNFVAQALLGSARMANKLSNFNIGNGIRKVYPPETYLRDALERIGQAKRVSADATPAVDRLKETEGSVRRMLQAGSGLSRRA